MLTPGEIYFKTFFFVSNTPNNKLANGKHSSLFVQIKSDKENSFKMLRPGEIFKLFYLLVTLQTKNLLMKNTLAYLYRVRVTQRDVLY
jgi:hypothetical protein